MENLINSIASIIVMTDKDDIHGLKNISKLFRQLRELANEKNEDFIISLSNNAALFIDKIVLDQKPNIQKALSIITSAVQALYTVLENGEDAAREIAPRELLSQNKQPVVFKNIDQNLILGFIAETIDRLDLADQHLLVLESNPDKQDALNALFRIFHTIKGDAGIISYTAMSEIAHAAEDILGFVRNGEILLSDLIFNLIFESLDFLRQLIISLEHAVTGRKNFINESSVHDLLSKLRKILPQNQEADSRINKKIIQLEATKPVDTRIQEHSVSMIKVSTSVLDKLFNAVGELGVIASMITQDKTIFSCASEQALSNLGFLDKTTHEILNICYEIRMMPIEPVFNKMARLVRDLSKNTGKQIEFIVTGQDTKLDRYIVEKIDEPLIHLIRNAIDHGIEKPDIRTANAKPAIGKIQLNAFHKHGSVYLEIKDNGKGLEPDEILAKAKSLGLPYPDNIIDKHQIYKLIFTPGFSTAEKVTEISGRGVGMDVVKQRIERLGGAVKFSSKKNVGTKVTIRLPMTLATIDGIVICVGKERYVIPTLFVVEVIIPEQDKIHVKFGKNMALDYRGNLIPFYKLSDLMNINYTNRNAKDYAVIVTSGGKNIALGIDKPLGQQQFVVKKLCKILSNTKNISGAVIMPDGCVAFVLDIDYILNKIR